MDVAKGILNPGVQHLDTGILPMEGERAWKPLLQEEYSEAHSEISPDGRWITYTSNESGRNEIYVRSFPDVGKGKWQVSTNGGNTSRWSANGRELFYGSSAKLVGKKTLFFL
jgi:Tol biopolymer transport system component